ncbi:pLS20_p028 family conjugation system transmembrane protein [Hutsoniella sourekii]|uniref:pLS20_p028 family conjugation system transmembrane protein n=1 Tax=Hutsoniella sourekii TaxID=87650 RepID=UPI0004892201|nr:ion transporter [Hutsoniella sourekii]
MDNDQILQFLHNNEWLELSSITYTILRLIAQGIINLLLAINRGIAGALDDIFAFAEFPQSELGQQTIQIFSGVTFGIATLSLACYGILLMIDPEYSFQTLARRFLFGLVTLMLSATLMIQLLNVTTQLTRNLMLNNPVAVESADGDGERSIYQIINSNVIDVQSAINQGYLTIGSIELSPEQMQNSRINYNDDTRRYYNFSEHMDPENINDEDVQEALGHAVAMEEGGTYEVYPLRKFWQLEIPKNYYRYQWNPVIIILSLLLNAIAFVTFAFKFLKSMFELVFNQTLIPLFAFEDLRGSKALKTILNNMKNILVTMVLTALIYRVYILIQAYLANQSYSTGANIIIQLALVFLFLDGPVIIDRLTGDGSTGMRSSIGRVAAGAFAGYQLGKGAANLGKKIVDSKNQRMAAQATGAGSNGDSSNSLNAGSGLNTGGGIGDQGNDRANAKDDYVNQQMSDDPGMTHLNKQGGVSGGEEQESTSSPETDPSSTGVTMTQANTDQSGADMDNQGDIQPMSTQPQDTSGDFHADTTPSSVGMDDQGETQTVETQPQATSGDLHTDTSPSTVGMDDQTQTIHSDDRMQPDHTPSMSTSGESMEAGTTSPTPPTSDQTNRGETGDISQGLSTPQPSQPSPDSPSKETLPSGTTQSGEAMNTLSTQSFNDTNNPSIGRSSVPDESNNPNDWLKDENDNDLDDI